MLHGRRECRVHRGPDADHSLYVHISLGYHDPTWACEDLCCTVLTDISHRAGSPWDEDKAMMERWGLDGMRSFEQRNVARKEGARLMEAPRADEDNVQLTK